MKERLLAAGGIAGALAASSCCIAPLALVSLGVGGAWVGNLTALAPWQPAFLALAVVCLGAGFVLVYRPASRSRASGTCAAPRLGRVVVGTLGVKGALWAGTALVVLAAGADAGARLLL